MKKIALLLVSSGLLFAGCSSQTAPTAETPVAEKKAPNTTLAGKLTKVDGKFYLSAVGRVPTELDSYTVKLDSYVDKEISVTGQFSGTTLFVDTVNQ